MLQQEALTIIELLQEHHYASRPFHELDAPEFLDRYLLRLDPERLVLTAGDVAFLHRRFDRNLKTVYLFAGDVHPAFEIYDLFASRALARSEWVQARLQQPFALNQPGSLALDREAAPWPADPAAADVLAEQWLQARLVGEIVKGRTFEKALGRERAHWTQYRERIFGMDPLVVREQFLTCLLEFFDPHSGYFSRAEADEFDIKMAGTVAGIGLDLQAANGRFLVAATQPGSPSDLSGALHPGDEIVAAAEGDAPPRPLAGLRLRDAVRIIRGQPDTRLTLLVRAAGPTGEPRPVPLTRARVGLSTDHARGFLVRVPTTNGPMAIGVIDLPAFYGSRTQETVTISMADEIRELLLRFAEKGAQGLVIDLRDNGGGLILEAGRLGGLFLQGGPLAFTQGLGTKPEILHDDDPTAAFAGPLVVLTSPRSASASELFSGTMQCYRRALIVGSATTFGKGTVQTYVDFRTLAGSPDLKRAGGIARITSQLYYLPDGRSPQRTGVVSDIVLPSFQPAQMRTEGQLPHALPAAAIPPPEAIPAPPPTLASLTPELLLKLQARTRERLAHLPEFALHQRRLEFLHEIYDVKEVSLPLDLRQQQQTAQDERSNTLREERQRLGEQLAFDYERVDIATVAAAEAEHQKALRLRRREDDSSCANQFDRGLFYGATEPSGPIRDIAITALDLDACRAAAPQLAAAWTKATEHPIAVEHVRAILADLESQRENPDPALDTAALFRRHLGAPLDEGALGRGLSAFFRCAVELQPHLLHDMAPLDVALRESLRLAADWALAEPLPSTPRSPTATPSLP